MLISETLALSELSSFLALIEGSKHYMGKELRTNLVKDLRQLRTTLKSIDASLSRTHLPSDWLANLERYMYEVEDIEESMKPKRKKKIVRRFLEKTRMLVNQMQKLVTQMQKMEAPGPTTNLEQAPQPKFPAGPFLRVEVKNIIEELMKESKSHGVSIIGICGSGKTTLTEAIAEEARIRHHFPCILIPPQSSSFNSKTVLDYINKHLPSKDQKVLILLDDLPELDVDDWGPFNSVLGTLAGGSKFVITTQSSQVASLTGTSKHFLHPLSGEEIIKLIHECANANRNLNEADDRAIRHNKEELVDTCRGLPFLAIRIGLLLSAADKGHRLDTIRKITANCCWKVPDLARVLLNLKPVSLLEQQPHLKRCLAFCSLFPQDHDFKKDKLARFWMAEGFTRLSSPTTDSGFLFNDTRQYFQDLLSCSIFQASEVSPGEEPSYKMHKLAYDLAQTVASNTFCRRHIGNSISTPSSTRITEFTRHFSLSCDKDIGDGQKIEIAHLLQSIEKDCRDLRTFLLYKKSGEKIPANPKFFRRLTRLRVLDLSYTKLTNLQPSDISELKYLCYLDLSHTFIEKLPTLSRNPLLQVLKLKHCYNLFRLPTDFAKMTNLVSLHVNTTSLGSTPPFIGKLEKLQRLDVFIVGKKEGSNIRELMNLNGLRKSLRITQLENVKTKKEAQMAELCNKKSLDRLELIWTKPKEEDEGNSSTKEVLEGLEPQKNLKELMIRNYYGSEFPQWLSDVCGLLQSIHLDGCRVVPSLIKLESLVKLQISNCRMLEKLDEKLPQSLQILIIKDCGTLRDELAERLKIRGINLEIVTSEQLPAAVDEAVGHQSSSIQQGSRTSSSLRFNFLSCCFPKVVHCNEQSVDYCTV